MLCHKRIVFAVIPMTSVVLLMTRLPPALFLQNCYLTASASLLSKRTENRLFRLDTLVPRQATFGVR